MLPSDRTPRRPAVITASMLNRWVSTAVLTSVTLALLGHSAMLLVWQDVLAVPPNLLLELVLLAAFWWWCTARSGSLLAAPFVFTFTIFFWHSGFLAGRVFHADEIFEWPGSVLTYGEEYVPAAVALVSFSMGLAVVGAMIAYAQCSVPDSSHSGAAEDTSGMTAGTRTFAPGVQRYAWLLFGAYLVLTCVYQVVEGRKALEGSYIELYAASASGTLLYRVYQMTKFLGVPFVALILAVSESKLAHRVAIAAVLLLVFVSALTGARTMPFLYVSTMVLAIDYFRRRVPLKAIVILALAAASMSWIMSEARASGVGLHVFSLRAAGGHVYLWHLVWNSGGSIRAVLRTMAFTAHSTPEYGLTFLQALAYVIPSPIVAAMAPSWHVVPPSEWMLAESLDVPRGEPNGMGYSLIAEAFLNFRVWGALLFLLLGWVIAYLYFRFRRRGDTFAGLQAATLVVLLALHLRNDAITYLRVVVWAAGAIWFAAWLQRRHSVHSRPAPSEGPVAEQRQLSEQRPAHSGITGP